MDKDNCDQNVEKSWKNYELIIFSRARRKEFVSHSLEGRNISQEKNNR